MYRQGDVLLVPIKAMPKDVKAVRRENGRTVLAHGEITGHAHAIKDNRAALFRDPETMNVFMYVGGERAVVLEHEEHNAIDVPPGTYQIIRQREYAPGAFRNVAD
jgi:hypothetical protein